VSNGELITFGSICSGIEAASVAFGPLGWRAAWLAEIEAFPSAVLKHHYPTVPNLGDMTTIARRVLSGEVDAPDVLCGGTPCQAFSVAGLRNSLDDARGNLTLKFVELADAIDHRRDRDGKPAASILWENVPGVLSTKDNAFGCFLAGLAGEDEPLVPPGKRWTDAGAVYGPRRAIAWRTLDAQYFGLAQRRRRVFVVASARDGFDPAAVLFEWQGVRRDSAPSRGQTEDVAGTVAGGARKRGGYSSGDIQSVAATLDASFGRLQGASGQDANHGHSHLIAETLRSHPKPGSNSLGALAFGGNNCSGPVSVSSALSAHGGSGRMDFESETFIAGGRPSYVPEVAATMVARSSRGAGQINSPGHQADSELIAFNARQTPISGPIDTDPGTNAIAFTCKDHGADACADFAPTMRAMNHAGSHANAGGQLAVYTTKLHNTASNGAGKVYEEDATSLDANSPAPALLTTSQVRRLTPRECERLQGFPDDYTRIPSWTGWRKMGSDETPEQCIADGMEVKQNKKTGRWRVKDVDGPRYKALGNSWAIPNVRWIGARIDNALRATA
jgi:DNA (cytosine-5)-methyltransferase 1